MNSFVFDLRDLDKTKYNLAGGKAANLGELTKINGVNVPDGFCISTSAFRTIIQTTPLITELFDRLSSLKIVDRKLISEIGSEIRSRIEQVTIPEKIESEIGWQLSRLGENNAYAIRSSATAEDLPIASFAGQQDTYLNIIGKKRIQQQISKCWASLFTERAITYRIQNGFDHDKVALAVIVQQMVFPEAAGIMFTADPISGNRKILSIDASFGLGEAMVSGIVNADNYKIREGNIIDKKVSVKKIAVAAVEGGGTIQQNIDPVLQNKQALTDAQIIQLEQLGRKVEKHFGHPQDIEWCLANNELYVVQSRPITTLYPIPETNDGGNRVYVSVGHQQMMTDPIRPLGISVWLLTGAGVKFKTAGGRLFLDITAGLSTQAGRQNLLNVLGHSDPLIKDALLTIIERGDFITLQVNEKAESGAIKGHQGMSSADILAEAGSDPQIASKLITESQRSISELKRNLERATGSDVFELILEDLEQRRQRSSDLKHLNVIMAPIHASAWLNEKMSEWLGEKNVADILSLSVPNNITSEMGMQLLDVADAIRPYAEIVEYLQQVKSNNFLDGLLRFKDGIKVREAIMAFLDKYGMRCAGEIDITRTRWSENPTTLIAMIVNNIKNLELGASTLKFEQGRQEALKKEQELLIRLKQLPVGEEKAKETKQMIDVVRHLIGYREYPKYDIVSRYFVYKQALLREAERLVRAKILNNKEDIYYLSFDELRNTIHTNQVDYQLIQKRKEEYLEFEKMTPPRVITSDGEIIRGKYKKENLPSNAIVGLAVSSGVAQGRARVITSITNADLQEGDILVTSFTDPSWTPLFLSIKGLVTEVGGLMTHGAVIAREYGLPAVVGVENATSLIKDGQQIRVHGTEGYVELL